MDATSENSEQRSFRLKLGLTRDGRDLDECTLLQDDLGEDTLRQQTPISTHEESGSSGLPRFVFTVGDNTTREQAMLTRWIQIHHETEPLQLPQQRMTKHAGSRGKKRQLLQPRLGTLLRIYIRAHQITIAAAIVAEFPPLFVEGEQIFSGRSKRCRSTGPRSMQHHSRI
jgi:hypothetical protein